MGGNPGASPRLLEGPSRTRPASCDPTARGRLLTQGTKRPELFGEPPNVSAILGLLVALGLCVPLVACIRSKPVAVVTGTLLRSVYALFGVGVRKLVKGAVRLLS
jgi:hypothetical protein